ncbi:putative oncoprotein-induced transcript 3 protein [Apostichopus japonicus]|uniref:Putative oncoprotein-induced transcript 3 protein n=1 Tax=Stichopus japonicus TaxID=307972 RepID=A0A2G8L0F1_STIJA|nr:putative oncoprotein-induced transcript 3 protein [Apostichopus japonicus]
MTPKGEMIFLFFLVFGFCQIVEGQNITKNLTGTASFEILFDVFSDADFVTLVTESSTIETNQQVYLKAEVNHITGLDLIGTHCYTTPGSDPNDNTNYTIITDGCSESEFITSIRQDVYTEKPNFAFEARVFRFTHDDSDSLYFHCTLTLCNQGTCPPGTCLSKRRKRSTNAKVYSKVSTGLVISK